MIRAVHALLLCLLAAPAWADDNRPLTVAIEPGDGTSHVVRWKIPPNIAPDFLPALVAPENCSVGAARRTWSDGLGHWREERWTCAPGLEGRRITIAYPLANPNLATIARLATRNDGPFATVVLPPGRAAIDMPTAAQAAEAGAMADFLKLGFEHIWEGFDHLLFVFGLILVAGTWRRILVTVTGFTIAHSLTLGLAALDIVRLPQRAVEAAIALSIVFLAVEIVKGPRDTLTWRRPVAVAAAFGLLHGFGFANVLREIGLPDGNFVGALFAFNIGIEIGQVIFAGLVFAALLAARKFFHSKDSQQSRALAGYVLGTLASYWLFERIITA